MSHALPRYRRYEERENDIRRVTEIIDGGSSVARARGTRLVGHRSGAGDPFRLRIIPLCTEGGLGSVIPGTQPEQETIERERQALRGHAVRCSSA